MKKIVALIFMFLAVHFSKAQLTLKFPSKDGLMITADWYPESGEMPIILLCHQARYSRGEFEETALRLNKFGFNCLSVDLRSGDEVNKIKNETALAAKEKNLNPTYADAEQDMVAAVDYLFSRYNRSIIILGSSYSASLALKVATENTKVSAVAVFSPGEYFEDKNFISNHIQLLMKPVFATSSREEGDAVTELLKDVNSRIKVQYIPASKGDHGSKVLWSQSPYNQEYWIALMSFLQKVKDID